MIQFLSKYQTGTCFGDFSIKNTFVVLIMENTDIACAGIIQAVFQRYVINERFGIIGCVVSGAYLSADNNLETVVEEAFHLSLPRSDSQHPC